jgi:hypothetical protein
MSEKLLSWALGNTQQTILCHPSYFKSANSLLLFTELHLTGGGYQWNHQYFQTIVFERYRRLWVSVCSLNNL